MSVSIALRPWFVSVQVRTLIALSLLSFLLPVAWATKGTELPVASAPAHPDVHGLALSFMPGANPATPYQSLSFGSSVGFQSTGVAFDNGTGRFQVRFVGANPGTQIKPIEPQAGHFNSAHGRDRSTWRTDIPLYGALVYESLYPGVELRYDGAGGQLKGTYTVAAYADPSAIRWQYPGAQLSLDHATGNLVLRLPDGSHITEFAPIAWQNIAGKRVAVPAQFAIDGETVRFELGTYNTSQPLVIDPTLKISTFLGGSSSDYGRAVAVDGQGNIYVLGDYFSNDFLGDSTPPAGSIGMKDAILLKLNPTMSEVLYGWTIGGPESDEGVALVVNSANEAFALIDAGDDFPVENAALPTEPAFGDAVLAKFDAAGRMSYMTYVGFGAINLDTHHAMAFDANGALYITGETYTAVGILYELALGKFNPATGAATQALIAPGTYRSSHAAAIAIGTDGAVYLTGQTESRFDGDFPTTPDALQSLCGRKLKLGTGKDCDGDAFLLVLNPDFSVRYASYLGGSGDDEGVGIVVDNANNVTIAGNTGSTDFPIKDALQTTCPPDLITGLCSYDGFVTHVTNGGKTLGYSTYIAPKAEELAENGRVMITDLVSDAAGNAYAYGYSNSTNIPIKDAVQGELSFGECVALMDRYCFDSFVVGLTPTGALQFGTYLGGKLDEWSTGITLDKNGALYLIGYSEASDFPTTDGTIQPNRKKDKDFYLSKIELNGSTNPPPPGNLTNKVFTPLVVR